MMSLTSIYYSHVAYVLGVHVQYTATYGGHLALGRGAQLHVLVHSLG